MPTFFGLITEYFWLIALGIGAFNYRMARGPVVSSESSGPLGEAGEREIYLKRFALVGNLPWLVMGLGKILGYTATIWYYFRPQDGNPFVIAWLAVVLIVTCTYAWWVLFAGGAQKVRDLNLMTVLGQRRSRTRSLFSIKLFAALGPLFFMVWLYLVVSMNVSLPK
jgi:hypothetical protein